MLKKLLQFIEAFLLYVVFVIVRIIPFRAASAMGGALARLIGPCMRVNRTARKNLKQAFPEKSDPRKNAWPSSFHPECGVLCGHCAVRLLHHTAPAQNPEFSGTQNPYRLCKQPGTSASVSCMVSLSGARISLLMAIALISTSYHIMFILCGATL